MIDASKPLDQWGPIDSRVLYISFWFLPISRLVPKVYGTPWPDLVGILQNHRVTFFWEHASTIRRGGTAIRRWLEPIQKRRLLRQDYQRYVAQLEQSVKRVEKLPANVSGRELAAVAREFYDRINNFWTLSTVFELANFAAPAILDGKIAKFVPVQERSSVVAALLASERLSFHAQSEYELYRLCARCMGRKRTSQLAFYARTWHWVENSYYGNRRLTAAYFAQRLKGLSVTECRRRMAGMRQHQSAIKKRKQMTIRKYGLPKGTVNLAQALAYSIWWQDHRKAVSWRFHTAVDSLSKIAAARYSIPSDSIADYLAEEWIRLLETGQTINQRALRNRRRLYVYTSTSRGYRMFIGSQAHKIARPFSPNQDAASGKNVLHGTAVSQGRVTGRVRILMSSRDASTMRKNEILVAPMTSPDFISAMRLAKAIVTDVGGLMSHAAIIARELGKPCVVGTKFATRLLHNGDWVEVDAEKGIVRKI